MSSIAEKYDAEKARQRDAEDIDLGHAVTAKAFDNTSQAWSEARRRGIGGSDVATIMGMQPYGSNRVELWREKMGRADRKVANEATRFGKAVEPYIRQWLRDRAHDTPAIYGDFEGLVEIPVQLHHPDYPWARAHVDGHTPPTERGCEIKQSTHPHGDPKLDWRDGVMIYHYAQIQHYLWVTGLKAWDYVYVEVPGERDILREERDQPWIADVAAAWAWLLDQCEVTHRVVTRDDGFIESMVAAEKDYWIHVRDDTEPEKWLPDGEIRINHDEFADLLDTYGQAHADGDDDRKDDAKAKLKALCEEIAARHDGGKPKKIWADGTDDYCLWHGSGYWVAKPAERDPSGPNDGYDVDDLPF